LESQLIAKESIVGPNVVTNLALVYAWTGERDRALEQVKIIATIPGEGVPMYSDLRCNPCWDDLRGDKRFDKIVAAAKAASNRHEFHEFALVAPMAESECLNIRDNSCNSCRRPLHSWHLV
jgi:hypothetical protein